MYTLNCVLKQGSMFGEQALIYKRSRAAHCIVVSDNCDLCVMNKRDFDVVMRDFQRSEEDRKNELLEREWLTDPDMRSLIRIISVNFTKRQYFKNKTLFSKGERPDKLYFVMKGQILIWEDSLVEGEKPKQQPQVVTKRTKQPLQLDFSPPKKKKKFDLMIFGPGKMVGEEELFSGVRRRYHAIVESECVVYEIEFERMLNVCLENYFVAKVLREKTTDKKFSVDQIILKKRLAERTRTKFDDKAFKTLTIKLNQERAGTLFKEESTFQQYQEVETKNHPAKEDDLEVISKENINTKDIQINPQTSLLLTNSNANSFIDKTELQNKITRTKILGITLNPKFNSMEKITSIGMVVTKESHHKLPRLRRDTQDEQDENQSARTSVHKNGMSAYQISIDDPYSKSTVGQIPLITSKEQLFKKIMQDTTLQLQWSSSRAVVRKGSAFMMKSQRALNPRAECGSPLLRSTVTESCRNLDQLSVDKQISSYVQKEPTNIKKDSLTGPLTNHFHIRKTARIAKKEFKSIDLTASIKNLPLSPRQEKVIKIDDLTIPNDGQLLPQHIRTRGRSLV